MAWKILCVYTNPSVWLQPSSGTPGAPRKRLSNIETSTWRIIRGWAKQAVKGRDSTAPKFSAMGKAGYLDHFEVFTIFKILFQAMTVPLSSSWKFKNTQEIISYVCRNTQLWLRPPRSLGLILSGLLQALNSRSNIILQTNFSFKIFHSFLVTLCLICTPCRAGDSVHTSQGTGEKALLWNQRWICISKEFIFWRKKNVIL